MVRIVETDNYNGDYPNEKFLLFPMPKEAAQKIADAINEAVGPDHHRFWKVVDNDYVLQPSFEP